MNYIETSDGVALYVEDTEGSGPPIVFIHGWPLSGSMWEYQVVPLRDAGFRCVTYDRRGFGQSDKPATGFDYATLGADLAAVIEGLDLSDVTLVGFSMGGGEAIEYVSKHNAEGRVSRMALVASIIPFMLKTADNPTGVDGAVFAEMEQQLRTDRPAFLSQFARKFFGAGVLTSPVSERMLDAACQVAMQASPIATLSCLSSFANTDFRSALAAVDVETLVIHGSGDETVPIEPTSNAAARTIPGAGFKVYEGAPHGLFYTHRRELNADLATFASGGSIALAAE